MKVLGINCSPRVRGNTEIMLQEALNAAQERGAEVELWQVAKKKLSFCDGCATCHGEGICHIKDDMQELSEKLLACDGLILASPVYFYGPSAQAKAIIDRTNAHLHSRDRRLKNKVAGAIAVAASQGGTATLTYLQSFLIMHRMHVVGGILGRTGGQEGGGEAGDRGRIRGNERAMRDARWMGGMIVRVLQTGKQ